MAERSDPARAAALEVAVRDAVSGALGEPVVLDGLRPLSGGSSSTTWQAAARAATGDQEIVVKVSPPGLAPTGHRDVLRQAALLRRLAPSPVPVPAVLAQHRGTDGIPRFFVMQRAAGESVEPLRAEGSALDDEVARARLISAAGLLASLQRVPVDTLPDAGPPQSLEEAVLRWQAVLGAAGGAWTKVADECAGRLLATLPSPVDSTLVHGDFRLGNMLCVGAQPGCIVDWEIWGLGDPRTDLGWLLMMADPTHPLVTSPRSLVAPGRLIRSYESAGGTPIACPSWFEAFARFKQAAASALLGRNARRSGSVSAQRSRIVEAQPKLLDQALALVS